METPWRFSPAPPPTQSKQNGRLTVGGCLPEKKNKQNQTTKNKQKPKNKTKNKNTNKQRNKQRTVLF